MNEIQKKTEMNWNERNVKKKKKKNDKSNVMKRIGHLPKASVSISATARLNR